MSEKSSILYVSPHALASLDCNESALVAFSGGADSVALLHVMSEDAKKRGYTLYVAHFNHKIRGEDAERDAEFCRAKAEKYGLPFFLGEADVPALAKQNGNSLEMEAREQRYSFFEKIMREHNIPLLVTAHHADDNIETVLLHILRGSGTAGLCGITPHRDFATDLHLCRPMLRATKREILDFCSDNGLSYVTDATNDDTTYERNAIRKDVVPTLRSLRPNLADVFTRLGENAAETEDFMTETARRFIERECQPSCIPITSLNCVHTALRAKVLSMVFEETSGTSLEHVHIRALIMLAERGIPHSSVSLPEQMRAVIENDALCFVPDQKEKTEINYTQELREGELSPCEGVKIKIERYSAQKKERNPNSLLIAPSVFFSGAYFRPKRDGDSVCVRNINKKVKKLFNEKKVPLNVREKLPILVRDDEILWIPGIAVCDRLREDIINGETDLFRITVIID